VTAQTEGKPAGLGASTDFDALVLASYSVACARCGSVPQLGDVGVVVRRGSDVGGTWSLTATRPRTDAEAWVYCMFLRRTHLTPGLGLQDRFPQPARGGTLPAARRGPLRLRSGHQFYTVSPRGSTTSPQPLAVGTDRGDAVTCRTWQCERPCSICLRTALHRPCRFRRRVHLTSRWPQTGHFAGERLRSSAPVPPEYRFIPEVAQYGRPPDGVSSATPNFVLPTADHPLGARHA